MGTSDFTNPYNETNADAAKRLYTSATQKYDLKDYAEAVRLYEQAWQKDPLLPRLGQGKERYAVS